MNGVGQEGVKDKGGEMEADAHVMSTQIHQVLEVFGSEHSREKA